jgi:uncharacterized membrane protein YcaP (DUF421 family)
LHAPGGVPRVAVLLDSLIRDGRLIPQNLRMEMITEEELKSQLLEQSVEDFAEIKLATLEGDGRLSVLKRK